MCEYESLGCDGKEERFFAVVRVSHKDGSDRDMTTDDGGINTAAEAECWLQQFESVSRTNWRVDKTYPDTRVKLVFKVIVYYKQDVVELVGLDSLRDPMLIFL